MIAAQTIDAVAARVAEEGGVDEAMVMALRARWPDLHFTWCFDDDVGDRDAPVRELEGANIYLVDGSGHCLSITANPARATGVLIAEVEAEAEL